MSRVSRFASHLGVLPCQILDSASLTILYVHKHVRPGFWILTVETAVFDCIWWFSSSHDRKGQSYPVEYCLELVEEYSGGKIHMGEPKPLNGNVNTVYFVNQARGNTRISRTEFVYDEIARNCKCLLTCIFLSFLLRIIFVKNILLQKHYKLVWKYLARNLNGDVSIVVLLNLWVYGNWHCHAT